MTGEFGVWSLEFGVWSLEFYPFISADLSAANITS